MSSRSIAGLLNAQRGFAAALSCALAASLGCHNLSASLDGPIVNVGRDTLVDDPARVGQWPGWRGGLAQGIAPAESLPTTWSRREHVRFKTDIPGEGHSSPVVWQGAIFLTTVVGQRHREQLTLLKINRDDGQIAWQRSLGQPIGTPHLKLGHAAATVTTDGTRVYAFFGAKGLFCFDFNGERLWHQPLAEQAHEWGTASSPVIAGGLVLQLCDSQEQSFLTP
jgi:outer membrane protein assembly factor BamB